MDYSPLMFGKFGDAETRIWYIEHDKQISNIIDKNAPLKDQAIEAHNIRNQYKQQARCMMIDRTESKRLDTEFPIMPFDYYFDKYSKLYKTEDEIYKAIIDSSMRPNKSINKLVGLED